MLNLFKKLLGSEKQQQASVPKRHQNPSNLADVIKDTANGAPTTLIPYGSDERLFRAHLKHLSSQPNLSVIGVRAEDSADFMIIQLGDHSENAGATPAPAPRDKETAELLNRPVDSYSNYAWPGCVLESTVDFNRYLSSLGSGRYTVVRI